MQIVDTHQHFWDQSQFSYPWTKGAGVLDRSFSPADYEAAAGDCAIAKTVFMECDVDPPHLLAEAQHVQQLTEVRPRIAGIVAGCRPESAGFRAHLEALAGLPKVRGVRRVLHNQPDALSQMPEFRANLALLPEFGYTFDLCVLARQLPLGAELVAACPEVEFVLDHCGIPDVKGAALEPWRSDLRKLAALPNVAACKVSGLIAYADPDRWTVNDLRPWFEHVIDCFGWDRVIWGGDWPVCTVSATLREWLIASHALTAGATDSDRSRLFQLNAERIYRV